MLKIKENTIYLNNKMIMKIFNWFKKKPETTSQKTQYTFDDFFKQAEKMKDIEDIVKTQTITFLQKHLSSKNMKDIMEKRIDQRCKELENDDLLLTKAVDKIIESRLKFFLTKQFMTKNYSMKEAEMAENSANLVIEDMNKENTQ